MYIVSFDDDKCTGCGECVAACPVDIIELVDEKAVCEDSTDCLGCESCVAVCPTEACTVTEM